MKMLRSFYVQWFAVFALLMAARVADVSAQGNIGSQGYYRGSPIGASGAFTGQLKAPTTPADCTAPPYSFTGDLTTGYDYIGAGETAICSAGNRIVRVSGSYLRSLQQIQGPDGSAGTVAFGFTNATGTGWYRGTSSGRLIGSVGGTGQFAIDTSTGFFATRSDGFLGFLSGTAPDTNGIDTQAAREAADFWIHRRGTTAQRWGVANTWTSTSNKETFDIDWQTAANIARVGTRTAATGTQREMQLEAQASNGAAVYNMLQIRPGGGPFFRYWLTDGAGSTVNTTIGGTFTNLALFSSSDTSGTIIAASILPTYNQTSGSAANTDLLINRTETAIGSGTQLFADFQIAGVSKISFSRTGAITAPTIQASSGLNLFSGGGNGITIANSTGIISNYGSAATAGHGVTVIRAAGRATAQTAAVASVATFTVGASDASFEISANVLVTTSTTHNFTVQCTYTDESNTARTQEVPVYVTGGATTLTNNITNALGAGAYVGVPLHIRAKAATAITIKTNGTFTTVTYNVDGVIRQMT